jgi:integrase
VAKFKSEKHKHLSVDQVQLLLNGPRMAGRERDYYLLSLAYYLALRGGEAVVLKPEHVNLSGVEAHIPSEKRKPKRGQPVCQSTGRPMITIPILFGDSVIAGALQWAQRHPSPAGFMFPSRVDPTRPISTRQFRLTFRLWAKAAGLPEEVSAHSLRHSAGTHVYASAGAKIRASGADPLVLIRDFMRHANIATTSIYLHSSPDTISAARRAMGG